METETSCFKTRGDEIPTLQRLPEVAAERQIDQ